MPEEVEADQAVDDFAAEALELDLRHHRREPQARDGDVKAVEPDQPEEGGEEAAALRGYAAAGALDRRVRAVAAVAEAMRILADALEGLDGGWKRMVGHASASCCAIRSSSASRAARRARSTRATSSTGTWNSWTSRHAN